jgi:hypothetical protein
MESRLRARDSSRLSAFPTERIRTVTNLDSSEQASSRVERWRELNGWVIDEAPYSGDDPDRDFA